MERNSTWRFQLDEIKNNWQFSDFVLIYYEVLYVAISNSKFTHLLRRRTKVPQWIGKNWLIHLKLHSWLKTIFKNLPKQQGQNKSLTGDLGENEAYQKVMSVPYLARRMAAWKTIVDKFPTGYSKYKFDRFDKKLQGLLWKPQKWTTGQIEVYTSQENKMKAKPSANSGTT